MLSFCLPTSLDLSGYAKAEGNSKKITKVNGRTCAADEIIIKFKDSSSKENKKNTLDSIDPGYKALNSKNTVKIKIPKDKTLEEYLVELNQNPDIAFAQPNYLYQLDTTVTDPFAYPPSGSYYQWFHDAINTFEAWDYTMGAGATVAVLDTGAYVSHSDMGSNITLIPDIASNDNDGLPYDNSSIPQDDDHGHGTHVTGIIAATGNNSYGGLGIAPLSNVIVYDVFTHYEIMVYDEGIGQWVGTGAWAHGAFTDDIIIGIESSISAGVDIINMSLGGYQDPDSSEYWDLAFEDAVSTAVSSGVVVVCSAGNDNLSDVDPDPNDDEYTFHRPSDYDSAISVINIDVNSNKSSTSNYGPLKDISAPGENIVSTMNNGSYASFSGTSMASPVVAGVCALILSADPTLTVAEVKEILYKTADDLGLQDDYDATYDEYRNDTYAFGRVNAYLAVRAAEDLVTDVYLYSDTLDVELGYTEPLTETIYPSDAINKNVTWSSDDESVATVDTDGVVTGAAYGTATITVTTEDGGYTDTCEVTVVPVAVTSVTLDQSTLSIVIGGSDTLNATVSPADAANKNITWSSDDESVATVSGGVVTSISVGTATITVTTEDGGYTDTCEVTVIPIPVTGVSLNKSSTSLYEGASELLKATVSPDTAGNKNVSWSSNNESVATVASDGMITAHSTGSATITVTTNDGSYTDTCTVTVSSLTPVTIDETVKIKLSVGSLTSLPIYVDGNFSVQGGSGDALERQQYHLDVEGSQLALYLGSDEIARGITITLIQHESTATNNFVWLDNAEHGPSGYLGNMVFSISGGYIQAINHVYIEDYLYGVVPYEMSDSWPAEALKSQAISARTYAAANIGAGTYDMVDTSSDQVYKGYDDSKVNAIAAVDGTAQKVLQYGDTLTPTYYAASNGGYTDVPLHVWGGGADLPFAIYEDPYDVLNTYSYYEEVFFPVVIDGDNPVTVSDNYSGGDPNATNAINYIKQKIFESGSLAGVSSLSDFTLTGVLELIAHTHDTYDDEDHSQNLSDGSNDCVDFVMATGKFTVSVGGGPNQEVSGIELDLRYFDASNGITTYKVFNMSALRLFVIEGDSETGWSICHRRYGHGVGMSQRGAQQRANSGHTFEQILAFYYPYSSRVDLSYSAPTLTSNPATDTSNAEVDCNDYLNVRSGPGTGYSIIGTLPKCARVNVTTAFSGGSDWHIVSFAGGIGYVHSYYITLDDYVEPTSVSIDTNTLELENGNDQTLIATVLPANAGNKTVTWESDNTSVATVDFDGKVTAVGNGTATITVTTEIGGHTDTCDVTVITSVTGVTLDRETATIYEGKSITLQETVSPTDATDKSVTWSSDNESAATVTDGVVTAVAEGGATITVTTNDGSFTDTCAITVSSPPTDAIYSDVYNVEQANSILLGVPDELTLSDMIANLNNSASDIVILGLDDLEITELSTLAGTGMKVQLNISDSVVDELEIVVLGDVDGNGIIDIIDYTYVKLHIFEVLTLADSQFMGGDTDKSDIIDIVDYTYIKLDIFDVAHIN